MLSNDRVHNTDDTHSSAAISMGGKRELKNIRFATLNSPIAACLNRRHTRVARQTAYRS